MGNKSNTGDVNQKKSVIKKTIDFFKDERFKIILFILLLALAIYLSFAFISYLFTWKQDQSFSYSEVISGPEITVDNWAGKQGAELGRIFLGEWFGIASFIIPFLLVLIAFKLIDKNFLPFWKSIRISLIGIILLSVTLGFVSGDTEGYLGSGLGGFHGYVVSQWLTAIFGSVGTILILFVLLSSYIIFSIPSSTTYLKKFFYRPAVVKAST